MGYLRARIALAPTWNHLNLNWGYLIHFDHERFGNVDLLGHILCNIVQHLLALSINLDCWLPTWY
jgi:hypothetical protein